MTLRDAARRMLGVCLTSAFVMAAWLAVKQYGAALLLQPPTHRVEVAVPLPLPSPQPAAPAPLPEQAPPVVVMTPAQATQSDAPEPPVAPPAEASLVTDVAQTEATDTTPKRNERPRRAHKATPPVVAIDPRSLADVVTLAVDAAQARAAAERIERRAAVRQRHEAWESDKWRREVLGRD